MPRSTDLYVKGTGKNTFLTTKYFPTDNIHLTDLFNCRFSSTITNNV